MFQKSFLCVLAMLHLLCALTPPPDTIKIDPPKLTCNSGDIKLSELRVHVEVVGTISQTTYTMLFHNKLNRILEAELEFPLPQGATVSRFAMDINGKLREAVSVEKAKGRQIFEDIVRQNIDPGLLEKTKGNNYKARIYPVPAKGYKKVVIRYESNLRDEKDHFLYTLPLEYKKELDTFSIDVNILDREVTPKIKSAPHAALTFSSWNKGWSATMKESNTIPKANLQIALPKINRKYKSLITADGTFHITVDPKLETGRKKAPKSISLYWDVSNSAEAIEKKAYFTLLKEYLTWVKNGKISIIPFRNRKLPTKEFTITNGDSKKLLEYLESLDYDGGTQLGILDFANDHSDEILLVTDGISNFGKSQITVGTQPVFPISNALVTDHEYLTYIAAATGGVYLNLQNSSVVDGLQILTKQPLLFLGIKEGNVQEVYPALKQPVVGSFSLAGKLTSESETVTLLFGQGSKVSQHIAVNVSKSDSIKSALIPLIWAQKKLESLSYQYERNRDKIDAHAITHNLVTKDRSLIILDRVEDYVEHNLTPPKELLPEFLKLQKRQIQTQKEAEKESVERVLAKLDERYYWWQKDFDYKGCSKPSVEKKKEARRPRREVMAMEEAAPMYSFDEQATMDGDDNFADAEKAATKDSAPSGGSITLKKWSPDTPYLKALKAAQKGSHYQIYLREKKAYANSSAFFLDVADFFIEQNEDVLALQILSNIAEMKLENPQLLRILAHRLRQLGKYSLAIALFKEVAQMREEEPQSYRDLGLTYADNKEFALAIEMLYKVAIGTWDSRFSDIDIIALNEMNGIICNAFNAQHKAIPFFNKKEASTTEIQSWMQKLNIPTTIDPRLVRPMPCDVRVVLNWDADNCDMDLWVTDPIGEKCDYQHQRTCIGGHMSRDFTQGYGPEEFLLKRAMPGEYAIEVNYYGNSQQTLAGATTIQVELITDFGKPSEKRKAITLRLKDAKEVIKVGTFSF